MKMNHRFINPHVVVVLAAFHLSASPSLGFALGASPPSPALAVLTPRGAISLSGVASRYSLLSTRKTRPSGNLLTIRGGASNDAGDDSEDDIMSDANNFVGADEGQDDAVVAESRPVPQKRRRRLPGGLYDVDTVHVESNGTKHQHDEQQIDLPEALHPVG